MMAVQRRNEVRVGLRARVLVLQAFERVSASSTYPYIGHCRHCHPVDRRTRQLALGDERLDLAVKVLHVRGQ